MYKRIVVISVSTIVVILILMVSTILLPTIHHAGSGAAMSTFTDDSVSGLLSNPGPEGIALREAISATNNDPREYTITFSPALDGFLSVR